MPKKRIRKPLTASALIESLGAASQIFEYIELNPGAIPTPGDSELGDLRRWRSDLTLLKETIKLSGLQAITPAGAGVAGRAARGKKV